MKNIVVKSFIVAKELGSLCQDSLAVNLKCGRFAVADGVTNSNHSEFFSRLLSESFVASDIALQDWETEFNNNVLPRISEQWKEMEEAVFAQLTGRQKLHAQIRRNDYSPGASTLAGIEIDKENKRIYYQIIGDSTLFFIGTDGSYYALNSSFESKEKGALLPFDNMPGSIVADGKTIYGDWKSGQHELQTGYVVLMTDGCAKWFQEAYSKDGTILDILWNLSDNQSFANLADDVWKKNPKYEDDWAAVLLKIEDVENEMAYFPENQQAVLISNDESNVETGPIIDDKERLLHPKEEKTESDEEIIPIAEEGNRQDQPEIEKEESDVEAGPIIDDKESLFHPKEEKTESDEKIIPVAEEGNCQDQPEIEKEESDVEAGPIIDDKESLSHPKEEKMESNEETFKEESRNLSENVIVKNIENKEDANTMSGDGESLHKEVMTENNEDVFINDSCDQLGGLNDTFCINEQNEE